MTTPDDVERILQSLDRIADVMALSLVKDLEREEQIRILAAAGYPPAKIGSFLGMRANTVSVALTRARRKNTKAR